MPNIKSYKLLALDESGKASYSHSSPLFILSGVVIPEKFKAKLYNNTKKLKKRYFKDEDIIFHGRDIVRKKGKFKILKDPIVELKFWGDLISILNNYKISTITIITNKQNAKNANWLQETILKKSYLKMLEIFVQDFLTLRTSGKIIVESAPQQDIYLIKAHSNLQCNGLSDGSISAQEYFKRITSLSLVNKPNLDINVQMADVLCFMARLKYNLDIFIVKEKLSRVNTMKIKFFERKLSNKSNPSVFEIII